MGKFILQNMNADSFYCGGDSEICRFRENAYVFDTEQEAKLVCNDYNWLCVYELDEE